MLKAEQTLLSPFSRRQTQLKKNVQNQNYCFPTLRDWPGFGIKKIKLL